MLHYKQNTFTLRQSSHWYSDEIRSEKAKRKQLENKWRSTKLTVHRDIYKTQRNKVERLIKKAKRQYYNNLIIQCNEQGFSTNCLVVKPVSSYLYMDRLLT